MARNKYDVDEVLEDKFDLNQLKRLLAISDSLPETVCQCRLHDALRFRFYHADSAIFSEGHGLSASRNKDMKGIAFYSFLTLLAAFYSAFSLRYKIKYHQPDRTADHPRHALPISSAHLQELPFSYYDDRPHGKIQVRVVNYVNSISDLLSNGILKYHHRPVQPDVYHRFHAVL